MSNIGGYLANLDHDLSERIESQGYFTDALRLAELRYRETLVCFISFDGESIEYAGLLERQRVVASSKCVVNFSDFVELGHIRLAEIQDGMDSWDSRHVVLPAVGAVHATPDSTWLALMNTIKRLRPEAASKLEVLEALTRPQRQPRAAPGFQVMAEEKNAIGLAMSIFGVKREEELTRWTQQDDQPAPFINGLRKVRLREDTMINHDASVFGGKWERFKDYQVGAVEFHRRRSNQHLTIMNVNRTTVERTMGVDLLYYHHQYQSFVMIQYKRMESGVFRPTDQTYQNEIKRLRKFETNPLDLHIAEAVALDSYRLHAGAFYFKLCPSTVFKPLSSDLIEGMYLPLDYWGILERSQDTKGNRGGLAITRENMGRHITNTLFVQLVQDGWIGSRLSKSDQLERRIQELIEQDRSVVVAISA